jgi:hypothetical protein
MEVAETAACGISERQFAIMCDEDDLPEVYRIMHYVETGIGHYEEEMVDDLKSQIEYIVGPEANEEPEEGLDTQRIEWKEVDGEYHLIFSQTEVGKIMQIMKAVETPGEGFDKELNLRLMAQIKALAPSLLDNLPIINR